MGHHKTLFVVASVSLLISACGGESVEQKKERADAQESAQYDGALKDKLSVFKALPTEAPNEKNIISAEKVKLGQVLYFDKRLSKNNTISCNSCHNLATSGVDNEPTSTGDTGEKGGRNSPTVLNAALHVSQFWDGRAKDVEEQAGMPIMNPIEMAIPSKDFLVKRLSQIKMYEDLFHKAFPQDKQPLTYENIAKAIASFERQLLTPSRFDSYLQGNDTALTVKEKKGLLSFINIGCISCHSGSLLGGTGFQKFGVHKNYWEVIGAKNIDEGLFKITKQEFDKYKFKVPSLRNSSQTRPYFHDGSISDLKRVIEIMAQIQLNYQIDKDEVENIAAFLNSLTGKVPEQLLKEPAELKN
jgi:cytochrome c peroxidase